jgi:NAD(P)-dependent dehydrogenase (short-subunit alcohol dehydrogenase family)
LWDIAATVQQVADGLGMPGAVVDVCDDAALADAVTAADTALDGLDGLVHAAGRVLAEPVGAFSGESWDAILDVNLRAQAMLVQLMLPHLEASARAGRAPAVVGISSIEGLTANPFIPAYCASKAGLLGLTRSMAAQLGPAGIRVNAVCPGFIHTPMLQGRARGRRSPGRFRSGRAAGPHRRAGRGRAGGGVPDVAAGVVHHRYPPRGRRRCHLSTPLTFTDRTIG